jgi:AraC family transcriptional regulator, regulatory protein of adaptative response / methylated-DNA-[protein]-cysteine methyltransferase
VKTANTGQPTKTAAADLELHNDMLWKAIESRDSSYDGAFFFAVTTTGVYCRPSCPARRPRRERVVFFLIREAAEHEGFRPCLRCRPQDSSARDSHVDMVQRACRLIEEIEGSPTLASLAEDLGVSLFHLQRVFRRVTGITPREYSEARRLHTFKAGIKKGDSVTTAIYNAGYGSASRLYERAPAQLGMTPNEYRRGAPGASITYAIADSFLGRLLVAATEKGICCVRLGESDAELEAEIKAEFPAAEMRRDDGELSEWIGQLSRHLEGKQPHIDLPLDVRATAFQWRVWQELRKIPYGGVRSYGEIARAIGQPGASRAVGRAIATNPAAIVIPCHRVIREDRGIGGYRWGVERKKALLKREGSSSSLRLQETEQ